MRGDARARLTIQNSVPESHTANVRLPKLKQALSNGIRRCHASTRLSSASVTAPGLRAEQEHRAEREDFRDREARVERGNLQRDAAADEGQAGENQTFDREVLTDQPRDAERKESRAGNGDPP